MRDKAYQLSLNFLKGMSIMVMVMVLLMSGCKKVSVEVPQGESVSKEVTPEAKVDQTTEAAVDDISSSEGVDLESNRITLEELSQIQGNGKIKPLSIKVFEGYEEAEDNKQLLIKSYPVEGLDRLKVLVGVNSKGDGVEYINLHYLSKANENEYRIFPTEENDETIQDFVERVYGYDEYLIEIDSKNKQLTCFQVPKTGEPKLIGLKKEDHVLTLSYEDGSERIIEDCPDNIMVGMGFDDTCFLIGQQIYFNIEEPYICWHYVNNKKVWRQYDSHATLNGEALCINGLAEYSSLTYDEVSDKWKSYYTPVPPYLAGKVFDYDQETVMYVDDWVYYDDVTLKEAIPNLRIQEVAGSESIPYKDSAGKEWELSDIVSEASGVFGLEIKTNALIKFDATGGKVISNQGVRSFVVGEQGVLFVGYEEDAYASYYELATEKVVPILSINPVDGMTLFEDDIYLTSGDSIYRLSAKELMMDGSKVQMERVKVMEDTYVFDQLLVKSGALFYEEHPIGAVIVDEVIPVETSKGMRMLAHRINRASDIYCLYDWESKKWIDQVPAYDAFLENGRIYMSMAGFIIEYDPQEMSNRIVKFDPFPGRFQMVNDEWLLYKIFYDDLLGIGTTRLTADFIKDDWKPSNKDLYIISYWSLYSVNVFVYDNQTKKLTQLIKEGYCQVEETDTGFRYRVFDDQNNPLDWAYYHVEDGKSFQFFEKSDR